MSFGILFEVIKVKKINLIFEIMGNLFDDLFKSLGIDITVDTSKLRENANALCENVKNNPVSIKNHCMNSKTFAGAYNDLEDEDKQKVVDTINKVQGVFDKLWGIKSEPLTTEDLAGATVKFTTTGDDAEPEKKECKCKGECTCGKGKDCDCGADSQAAPGFSSIADSLLDEIESDNQTTDQVIADAFVKAVVAKLQDKKNKPYTLHPATDNQRAAVEVKLTAKEVAALGEGSNRIMKTVQIQELIIDGLKKETACKEVYLNQAQQGCVTNCGIIAYLTLK